MRKTLLIIAILVLIVIGIVVLHPVANPRNPESAVQPTAVSSQKQNNTFSYKGEDGKDALTLLQAQTTVSQDKSGLVNAIGGRKADNAKHEYWAFYVNGKFATVGPADYKTKNTDKIEWKIEKY